MAMLITIKRTRLLELLRARLERAQRDADERRRLLSQLQQAQVIGADGLASGPMVLGPMGPVARGRRVGGGGLVDVDRLGTGTVPEGIEDAAFEHPAARAYVESMSLLLELVDQDVDCNGSYQVTLDDLRSMGLITEGVRQW